MVKRKRKYQNRCLKHSNLDPKKGGQDQGWTLEEPEKQKPNERSSSRTADDDDDVHCKKKVKRSNSTEMYTDEAQKIEKPEKTKKDVFMNIVKSRCSFLFELQVQFRRQLGKFLPIINCKCVDLPADHVVDKLQSKKSNSAVNCTESSSSNSEKCADDKSIVNSEKISQSGNSLNVSEKESNVAENILKRLKQFQNAQLQGCSTEICKNIVNDCSDVLVVEDFDSCNECDSYVINNNFDGNVEENNEVKKKYNFDSPLSTEVRKNKRHLEKSNNVIGSRKRFVKRFTNSCDSYDNDSSLVFLKSCSSNYITSTDSTTKSDKVSFDDDFYSHLQDPTYYSVCSYENCLCQKSKRNEQNILSMTPSSMSADMKAITSDRLLTAVPIMTVKNKSVKQRIKNKSIKHEIIRVYDLRPRPRKCRNKI